MSTVRRPFPSWPQIALIGAGLVGAEAMTLIGLGFNPGWANGWPFGISQAAIFATFVSCMLTLIIVSGSIAAAAGLALVADWLTRKPAIARTIFCLAVLLGILLAIVCAPVVYTSVKNEMTAANQQQDPQPALVAPIRKPKKSGEFPATAVGNDNEARR